LQLGPSANWETPGVVVDHARRYRIPTETEVVPPVAFLGHSVQVDDLPAYATVVSNGEPPTRVLGSEVGFVDDDVVTRIQCGLDQCLLALSHRSLITRAHHSLALHVSKQAATNRVPVGDDRSGFVGNGSSIGALTTGGVSPHQVQHSRHESPSTPLSSK